MDDFESEIDFNMKDAIINYGCWMAFLSTITTIIFLMY